VVGKSGLRFWRCAAAALLSGLMLVPVALAQTAKRSAIDLLIKHNQFAEAEQQLWDLLRSNPDQGWALDSLAAIRLQQKRNPEAEALFRRALALNERDGDALLGLGGIARVNGDAAAAIGWYSKIVAITPANVAANKALAELLEQNGQYKESIDTINRLPAAARPPELLPVLAADYLALQQESKIPALIAQVLRLRRTHPAVALDLVAVLLKNGYLEDADKLLQAVRPAAPDADYLHILARVREAQGKAAEAHELLQQAVKLQPKSYELLFDCARFAAQHDNWEESIDFLRRADAVEPDRREVLLKLTLALLKVRFREKAVAVAKRLNAIAPDDPDAQYILAFALVEVSQFEAAEPIALKVVQAKPGDANAQLLFAIVQLNKGDLAAARQALDRSLAIDPNLQDAHYYSVLISERTGDFEAARKELDNLVKAAPNHAGAQAELGVLDLRFGDVEGARAALETATRLAPEVSQSHYQLGLAYQRLGLMEQAKTEMEQYQKLRQAEDDVRRREAGVRAPPK
jgi:tetratricopeptide (TPR) repeat protein